jgi:hypothetical protein
LAAQDLQVLEDLISLYMLAQQQKNQKAMARIGALVPARPEEGFAQKKWGRE